LNLVSQLTSYTDASSTKSIIEWRAADCLAEIVPSSGAEHASPRQVRGSQGVCSQP